jgi:hypothetical protein
MGWVDHTGMIVDSGRNHTARGIQVDVECDELNSIAVCKVNIWKLETNACWNAISIPM